MPPPAVLLEVCVDTPAGLLAAVGGGADRIELCSSLAVGGLTPSAGLMALAATLPCPARAMIRPRAGGFVYDERELQVMRRDIDAARDAGLAGVVFGASLGSGALDVARLGQLVRHAAGLEIAWHRCVDLAPDLIAVVDAAVQLGVQTVQTSGGRASAIDGVATIAAMAARAAGAAQAAHDGARLEILAAAGLRPDNVAALVTATGVRAVHGSCSAPDPAPDQRAIDFGFGPPRARATDIAVVRQMKAALVRLS